MRKKTSTECKKGVKKISTECKKKVKKTSTESKNKVHKKVAKKISTESKNKVKKGVKKTSTECKKGAKKISTECKKGLKRVSKKKIYNNANKKYKGRVLKADSSLIKERFNYYIEENNIDSKLKSWKHLGWCPGENCTASLSTGDLEENTKTIVFCYKCGYRGRIKDLLEEKKIELYDEDDGSFFEINDNKKSNDQLDDEFQKIQKTLNWGEEEPHDEGE